MKLRNVLLFVLIVFSQLIFAQNADNRFAFSLYGGLNQYNGDLGNGLKSFSPINPLGALSLSAYVSPSFDLGVQGSYGKYAFKGSYIEPILNTPTDVDFKGNKYEGFMYLDYKFANGYILSKNAFIQPFLTAGIGLAGYTGKDMEIKTFPTDLITPLGAGLKFKLSQHVSLTYKFLYAFTNHDAHDMARSDAKYDMFKTKSDAFAEHLLGVTFSLGAAAKDTDKDGVPDKKDKCPDTPRGVVVDANGCPLDGDGDGIADYLDKCPTVAGIAQFEGCPDSDGDGVQDSMDKCPDTPKGVKVDALGCPVDTDKDGIADYLDKCPTVAGIAKFDGCPDTDGDGIQDSADKCPEVPGLPEYNGCPKPTEEAVVSNNTPQIPTFANVLFETNKTVIRAEYETILNDAAKYLKENPTAKVVVSGNTDDQSTEIYNQGLSARRAEAVKQYLIKKGVDKTKITTEAYGETKPVADNATAEGRTLNRRSEIKIAF